MKQMGKYFCLLFDSSQLVSTLGHCQMEKGFGRKKDLYKVFIRDDKRKVTEMYW